MHFEESPFYSIKATPLDHAREIWTSIRRHASAASPSHLRRSKTSKASRKFKCGRLETSEVSADEHCAMLIHELHLVAPKLRKLLGLVDGVELTPAQQQKLEEFALHISVFSDELRQVVAAKAPSDASSDAETYDSVSHYDASESSFSSSQSLSSRSSGW